MIVLMELTVRVHHEDGAFWADVVELPGVFATGDDLDELTASLNEGLSLYLETAARISPLTDLLGARQSAAEEVRVAVAA